MCENFLGRFWAKPARNELLFPAQHQVQRLGEPEVCLQGTVARTQGSSGRSDASMVGDVE